MGLDSFDFACFVRTGLNGPVSTTAAMDAYPLDKPFWELLTESRTRAKTHIVLADETVHLSGELLSAVEAAFTSDRNLVAVTSHSDALLKYYGTRSMCHLAPWFSVVSVAYLRDTGLLGCKYETLEFFLCELAEQLFAESEDRWLVANLGVQVDYRSWAGAVLLKCTEQLITDFGTFERKHRNPRPNLSIPSQLRLRSFGLPMAVGSPEYDLASTTTTEQEQPLFSVICPAFKSMFFQEAVASVLNQTCSDWELLVIVDGPPEGDRQAILDVLKLHQADPRVRYEVQENAGTGPTRMRLAQMAAGQFVVTLDDDDVLHPTVLDVFRRAIEADPNLDVCRGGTQLIGFSDKYLSPRKRITVAGIPCDIFEANQPFAISRCKLIELGGFDGDESFGNAGEDSDLFLRVDACDLRTRLIDVPLYYRRLSTLNQTLAFSPGECMEHIKSLVEKHRPPDWLVSNIDLKRAGDSVESAITYTHNHTAQEVVTATRFFNYQTLGDNDDVLIDLEVTSLCNAVCPFCPRQALDRNERFISMDVVDILAEQLRTKCGRRQVILCGIGEPTLHPNLAEIVRTLTKSGSMVCMTTNGSRMSVNKFRELVDAGMVEFNFSLNAATADTHEKVMRLDDFAAVEDTLLSILDYKENNCKHVDVHVSFVLCAHNEREVMRFVSRWRDTPVSRIWIHPLNGRAGLLRNDLKSRNLGRLADEFKDDARVLVDVFTHMPETQDMCKIVQNVDFVSVDGEMLLCALDYRRSVRLGNVRDTSLRDLHFHKFQRYLRGEINSICKECDFCPTSSRG